jgi:hypothetical protein
MASIPESVKPIISAAMALYGKGNSQSEIVEILSRDPKYGSQPEIVYRQAAVYAIVNYDALVDYQLGPESAPLKKAYVSGAVVGGKLGVKVVYSGTSSRGQKVTGSAIYNITGNQTAEQIKDLFSAQINDGLFPKLADSLGGAASPDDVTIVQTFVGGFDSGINLGSKL